MYASNLDIKNWKNFRTPGPVSLNRRLFLVGPNASGKSNFLDIFRFLRDLCIPGGGLRQAITHRGGISTIRCLATRQTPDIEIDITLIDDDDPDLKESWGYHLVIYQDNNRNPKIKKEVVKHNNNVLLNRPDQHDKKDPLRLTQTALEQIIANKEFRPLVDFFKNISYQHLLPQVIRDPSSFTSTPVTNDPFGRDFLQRVAKTAARTRDSRLRKILNALKVAVPQLNNLTLERDKNGAPHLIGVYKHWRPNAGKQNESQFSDGTLRLFGILWSLFEGEGLLLMEEPELSLHVELVRLLPQMIERINKKKHRKTKRQVFVSTHSEIMLEDTGIGGEEVLYLVPSNNGTLLKSPIDDETDRTLLKEGLSVGEVVMPKTSPKDPNQLLLSFLD